LNETITSGIRLTHGLYEACFVEDVVPDEVETQFMYPTEELRAERDPLLVQLDTEALSETRAYLDTGALDISRRACELMYQRLTEFGVACELHMLSGSHGPAY